MDNPDVFIHDAASSAEATSNGSRTSQKSTERSSEIRTLRGVEMTNTTPRTTAELELTKEISSHGEEQATVTPERDKHGQKYEVPRGTTTVVHHRDPVY